MSMLREGAVIGILSGGALKVAAVGETGLETEFCNDKRDEDGCMKKGDEKKGYVYIYIYMEI